MGVSLASPSRVLEPAAKMMSTPCSLVASSRSLGSSCRWAIKMILLTPWAMRSLITGCSCAASSVMSSLRTLSLSLTLVPEGEEIDSSSWVVAPTRPILAPPSTKIAEGTILPLRLAASSKPAAAVVST